MHDTDSSYLNRRDLLRAAAASASVILLPDASGSELPGQVLEIASTTGTLSTEAGKTPIDGASWYVAQAEGDGLVYRFPAGTLAKVKHLAADFLLDGNHVLTFQLSLQEGEAGEGAAEDAAGLPQCSFRARIPLAFVDQSRWRIEREAAWLKPIFGGDRVDLHKVDRMTLAVHRKAPGPVRWSMTPLHAAPADVPVLALSLIHI